MTSPQDVRAAVRLWCVATTMEGCPGLTRGRSQGQHYSMEGRFVSRVESEESVRVGHGAPRSAFFLSVSSSVSGGPCNRRVTVSHRSLAAGVVKCVKWTTRSLSSSGSARFASLRCRPRFASLRFVFASSSFRCLPFPACFALLVLSSSSFRRLPFLACFASLSSSRRPPPSSPSLRSAVVLASGRAAYIT